MRSTTLGELALLANPHRAHFVRVSVDRTGAGDWIDLSNLEGYDWIKNVDITRAVDSPVQAAKVGVFREAYALSLATLIDGSKLNQGGAVLDAGTKIKIETATTGDDSRPDASDPAAWRLVFRGEIDRVSFPGDVMSLDCRDQGGRLIDTFIELQRKYPPDPATSAPVEQVMQSILDDNLGAGVVTLYSPSGTLGTPFDPTEAPGWQLGEYVQSKVSIATALDTLAQAIGWLIKYQWNEPTQDFQLQFFEPGRAQAAQGSITLTGLPLVGETFTINATAITAVAANPAIDEFLIGVTGADTARNIARAVNLSTEKNNAVAWAVGSVAVIEWLAKGIPGNTIAFTEALTNATADGAGLLGATQSGVDVTADHTFDAGDYFDFTQLAIDRKDVRNVVRVVFDDAATLERTTVERIDAPSIAKYGRRYMELAEKAGSPIDSVIEAHAFADAAREDLAEPSAVLGVAMPYFWPGAINDFYTFQANGKHFDTDQSLAVAEIQDSFKNNQARTMLTLRGKPSGGLKRWLNIEGRPGVAAALDLFKNNAAEGVTVSAGVGLVVVQYDDPRAMKPPINDWATTKIHLSTVAGFTPADTNVAARGKQTRFELGGLVPGTTYYVKIVIVDGVGNESTVSTQAIQATERVGPYHENNEREFGTINPNANFGVFTKDRATNPPDHWPVDANVWGTGDGEWFHDASRSQTGDETLTFNGQLYQPATLSVSYRSGFFLVDPGKLYLMDFAWEHGGDGGDNRLAFLLGLDFYDGAKAQVGGGLGLTDTLINYSTAFFTSPIAPNTPFADRGWLVAPAGVAYARVRIQISVPSVGGGGGTGTKHPALFFDNIRVARSLAKLIVFGGGNNRSIPANTWVPPFLSTSPALDNTQGFIPGLALIPIEHSYTIPFDGEYTITGKTQLSSLPAGSALLAKIQRNGADLLVGASSVSNGTSIPAAFVQIPALTLNAGDVITLHAAHNNGNRTIVDSGCFLSVTQLTNKG